MAPLAAEMEEEGHLSFWPKRTCGCVGVWFVWGGVGLEGVKDWTRRESIYTCIHTPQNPPTNTSPHTFSGQLSGLFPSAPASSSSPGGMGSGMGSASRLWCPPFSRSRSL